MTPLRHPFTVAVDLIETVGDLSADDSGFFWRVLVKQHGRRLRRRVDVFLVRVVDESDRDPGPWTEERYLRHAERTKWLYSLTYLRLERAQRIASRLVGVFSKLEAVTYVDFVDGSWEDAA